MIPSQRHLFNIPNDIVYFNTAYMSPLLKSVVKAIGAGTRLKETPWKIKTPDFFENVDIVRNLFASLLNVLPENIAIIPSASYGIETAAKNIKIKPDESIITIENQFPSNIYPWRRQEMQKGAKLIHVQQKPESSLTEALLNEINENCAVVAIPQVLWTSGALIDLKKVKALCHEVGAALVLDLTQSAGALAIDLHEINPDFAIAANYKWLLGPYSTGFMYVSPKYFNGIPLEEGWITRKESQDFSNLVKYTDFYQDGATRFDMGERANFSLIPGVIAALQQISLWGVKNIEDKLRSQNAYLAAGLNEIGLKTLPENKRGAHFLSATLPKGAPIDFLTRLERKGIYISERGGNLRITPHLWNKQQDFDYFLSEVSSLL